MHATLKYVQSAQGLIIVVDYFSYLPCSIVKLSGLPQKINIFLNSCRFLLQCLEDLDANLRKLNSRLFVIRGQPADVFPRLFKVNTTLQLLFSP